MDVRDRKSVLVLAVCIIFAILAGWLFYLQVINTRYRVIAENNALKYEIRYPARGLLKDRNGNILVGNRIVYDIMVTPRDMPPFDTVEFCTIFGLDTAFMHAKFREYRLYRSRIGYQTLTLLKQVPAEQYHVFAEKSFMFPGFSATPRTTRTYPYQAAGNLVGYLSEVDAAFIRDHPEYRSGDYSGRTGMEEAYEMQLRGEKGYSIYLRDVHNRVREHYMNGKYDLQAVAGEDITMTIDGDLQAYGEKLMNRKVGSVVAIEPSTGEILAMVSSPGIKTEQLAEIGRYYDQIMKDPYRPMFNRAAMSPQPPGSVFKLVNGLIGLQEGVFTPNTYYPCNSGYSVGKLKVGCHGHSSPLDLDHALMTSCNSYFCYVFRAIIDNPKYGSTQEGFAHWKQYVESFGFGHKLGTDIPGEQGGTLPSAERYDRMHGKNRWRSLSIISLSIGQGEIGCTPLHLANLAATVANRGYYYIPHIRKNTPESPIDSRYMKRQYTMVDTSLFCEVIEGMRLAVHGGPEATARSVAIPGITMCGKTGTAQNPHGDEHSVFICFAPKDNPQIAVAAYVENAGFGSAWAAPIASLMVERYLNGKVERKDLEQRISSTSLLHKVRVRRR